LRFRSLKTRAFRNLADGEIDTLGKDVFLVGENGQGKTNVLEALYFCSYGSSFRGAADRELVRLGEKSCSALAALDDPLAGRILIRLEGNKKAIEVDGKAAQDRRELLSVIPCIVFCHEDLVFVSGAPEDRRRFFDQTQSLSDPLYLDDLRKYRRILKTRNAVLKAPPSKQNRSLLDSLDPQLAQCGLQIMAKREEAARYFSAIFGPLYQAVAGTPGIGVRYAPSWKEQTLEGIGRRLEECREQEEALGASLSGPHRDRYLFVQGGSDFIKTASTGQRRLLALLLRTAQASRYSRITGKNPVLLLDDVLLELDPEKKRRFLDCMPSYDQAFYTFLPDEPFEQYRQSDTLVYQVQNGVLMQ
jgi:DNA replication and repair protein RecF